MDDDGIEIGKPIPIRVKVIVAGEEMTIDLTEVSQQVRGFFNSGVTTGLGCTQVAYKCITSPRDYPINDGSFRSLKSIVPPGRVVSATRPAPMRQWMTFPMTIIDTVFKALPPAIPDRVIAGHHADLIAATCTASIPRTANSSSAASDRWAAAGAPSAARTASRRPSASMTATRTTRPASRRDQDPGRRRAPRALPDSGGAGLYRGGLGVERIVRVLRPSSINSQIDRAHCKPWGLEGGRDATGNEVALAARRQLESRIPNAKM